MVKGKRKESTSMHLSEEALDILKKWKEKTGDKRFVFGHIHEEADLNDGEWLRETVQSINHSVNRVLKKVFKILELPPLTFHSGRHTFAIWSLNDGKFNIKRISEILGHSSVLTTERFYAKYIVA